MASSDRDVNLVIRAKNEASKAVFEVADAFKTLLGYQTDIGRSAEQTDGVLGGLGEALANLNRQAQALSALGVVAKQIDRASDAVARLEAQANAAADSAAPIVEKYQAAAQATAELTARANEAKQALAQQNATVAQARADQQALAVSVRQAETAYRATYQAIRAAREPSDQLRQSYRDQLGALQALYLKQEESRANYAAQKTALDSARQAYGVLNQQVAASAANQSRLEAESTRATAGMDRAQAALARARQEMGELDGVAGQATQALGGVAASQDAVSAASERTARTIGQVRDALEQESRLATGTGASAGPAAQATTAYRAQVQAVGEARLAMQQARQEATALGAQMAATDAPTQELAASFLLARANAATAEQAYQQQAQALNQLRGVTSGFNAFAERERQVVNEAAAAQANASTQAHRLAGALREVETAGQQTGGALPGQKTPRSDGTVLFGLRPYELQNLSYQINDIISGLASGQRVTQIFAQQGGQVFQLFQRQIFAARAAIIGMLPEIAAAGAVAVVVFTTIKRIADQAATLREFTAQLAGSADGSLYDPKTLEAITRDVEKFGSSLKNARGELKLFVQEGVAPEFLERFAKTAQNMADAYGVKVPDAAKKFAAAFTGGYEAIKKLDDEQNFLLAGEREQIRALFEEGDAAEARRIAYEAFERQQEKAASESRGTWSQAVRDLGAAWKNFIDYLAQTQTVKDWIGILSDLGKAAKFVTGLLPGADKTQPDYGAGGRVAGIQAEIAALERLRAAQAQAEAEARANAEAAKRRQPDRAAEIEKRFQIGQAALHGEGVTVDALDKKLADLRAKLKQAQDEDAKTDPTNPNSQANQKRRSDELDALRLQAQAIGDITDQQKVRLAGEKAYRDEILKTGDTVLADAKRQIAVREEVDRQRKAVNFGGLADKIVQGESGGRTDARNPLSSALGQGQFIEKTWLELFRKYFPDEAQRLGKDGVLELRKDASVTKQLIEAYARENAEILQKAGVAVNEASLYLAHFLGPQGALKVLQASGDTPVSDLLSPDAIRRNRSILQGRTAGQVRDFALSKVGGSDAERAALDVQGRLQSDIDKREAELRQTIDGLVASLEADAKGIEQSPRDKFVSGKVSEAQKRAADLKIPLSEQDRAAVQGAAEADFAANQAAETRKKNAELQVQLDQKLHGDNVILTRDQFIANEALKDNVDLTTQAGKAYADLQGKLFDINREQKAFNDVIGLSGQVTQLQGEIKDALAQGDVGRVRELEAELQKVLKELRDALPAAKQFAQAMGDPKMTAQLDKVERQLKNVKVGLIDAKQVNQQLAEGLTGVFDKGAQALAKFVSGTGKLKDVFAAVRDSFLSFASDFLRQIAEMIIKQQLLTLLAKSPIGKFIADAVNGLATGAETATVAGGEVSANAAVAGSAAFAATAAIPIVGPELAPAAGAAAYAEVLAEFLPLVATGLAHAGDIIGRPGGQSRKAAPAAFLNAARYHAGGIAGFAPDEVPTILKRNEEVLTESDPRHAFNFGKGGDDGAAQPALSAKIVNLFNPADLLAHAVADTAGQKVIINDMRQNRDAYRAALRIK